LDDNYKHAYSASKIIIVNINEDRHMPKPHNLNKASLRVWLRLLRTTNLIEKGVTRFLYQEFDTTLSRFDALSALERRPDGMTMSELSEQLLVTNGNTTSLVARLDEEGFVSRKQMPHDKRSYNVKITRKGLLAFQRMTNPHEKEIAQYFSGLSKIELSELLHLLEKAEKSALAAAEKTK